MSVEDREAAHAAAQKALDLMASVTELEQDYIMA
jgi:hypothetical protein